jgi:hypothetical protein
MHIFAMNYGRDTSERRQIYQRLREFLLLPQEQGEQPLPQEQGEQPQQPLEITEQLNQSLGSLCRRRYENITSTEQNLLDNALQVAVEMTEEHGIQTVGFADRRSAWLGHFLRGEVPSTGVDARELERESRSDEYQEMREAFRTRLQAKMGENSTTS